MDPAVALLAAHPARFTAEQAAVWVAARRGLLQARATPVDPADQGSSGCASAGLQAHAQQLAEQAAHALARLDAGLATTCERCGGTVPLARLDSAPAAVTCAAC